MSLKPQRVLWPTDFSELADHAALYVRALAEGGAAVHVIHVIPPPIAADLSVALPAECPVDTGDIELLNACRARLDEVITQQLGRVPIAVREVFFGQGWSGICEYAERAAIDLIVVATHGRTGVAHALIGSSAERVVQHAPCPVLVVKLGVRDCLGS